MPLSISFRVTFPTAHVKLGWAGLGQLLMGRSVNCRGNPCVTRENQGGDGQSDF